MINQLFSEICSLSGFKPHMPSETGPEAISQPAADKLLRALVPEGKDKDEYLQELVRRKWTRLIDPALVLEQNDSPLNIPVKMPEKLNKQILRWQLIEENETVHEGEIRPEKLKILDEIHIDTVKYLSLQLSLSLSLPIGYHSFTITGPDHEGPLSFTESTLCITPPACYIPPGLRDDRKIWGLACLLDQIRSRRNWGIGDLTDLKNIMAWAAENGAGTIAVNSLLSRPLSKKHKFFPELPSTSCYLDLLYLDPEGIADFRESEEARAFFHDPAFQVRLADLRDREWLDYHDVLEIKTELLELLWRYFQHNHLDPETERGWEFRHFQEKGGEDLEMFSCFQTLSKHFQTKDQDTVSWTGWPVEFQDPNSPEVAQFTREHQDLLWFYAYCQWQLQLQLKAIGTRAMELGLKIGLLQKLPLGIHEGGFETWYHPSLFAKGIVISEGEEKGKQTYGPPFLPMELQKTAYASLRNMLRANMRYAGAIRLDSIALLNAQYWKAQKSSDPKVLLLQDCCDNFLGIITLESHRNRCLVIGEHHEPLAAEWADKLRAKGIFLSRPGHFSLDKEGNWLVPNEYQKQSLVMASCDDLISLREFWYGHDINLQGRLNDDFDESLHGRSVINRGTDRAHLLVALHQENLLPEGHGLDPATVRQMKSSLIRAVHLFLARSKARMFLVQLADLPIEEDTAFSSPSIIPLYPLRQHRLKTAFELIAKKEQLRELLLSFRQLRGIGTIRPSALLADRRHKTGAIIPSSFYRLQLNVNFTFLQAAEIVPYLKELGITHCYCSPYLQARPGSNHGYDIINHGRLNPEIGNREDYEKFVAALDHCGMEQIADMVPNHMAVGADNTWWLDVLENGPASLYADFFDINWQPQQEELRNRILLPVLGDHYGAVLEGGRLQLRFMADKGSFFIAYYEHIYPIAPKTYTLILEHDLQRLAIRLGSEHEKFFEFGNLISSFANLPDREESAGERIEIRNRNKEVLKRLLARLCREVPEIETFIKENLIYFNGEPERPESYDALDELLSLQAYRLAFWRVASDEINYRRFFDINELAGIRMENKKVFDETHRFILDLIATGKVAALRIDHPDGLYDPRRYFTELQMAVSGIPFDQEENFRKKMAEENDSGKLPFYVVAEKILADRETLADDWPVHGTTGYDFSWIVNGLFVDQQAEKSMTDTYERFIGRTMDFEHLLNERKRLIMTTAMAGELNVLAERLHRLARMNRYTRDFTLNGLREALIEIVAFFPVYRTYFSTDSQDKAGREYVEQAVSMAKARQKTEDISIYDFLKSILLLEQKEEPLNTAAQDFVMKFQQYTGPVMAKGLEDTSFYIFNRLLSLNEVGGNPIRFGVSPALFHKRNEERRKCRPYTMLNTSTHDSKRSEDVRARINVLSEMDDEWCTLVNHWSSMNSKWKTLVNQQQAPSANDEYAVYQNLLGVWPLEKMDQPAAERLLSRFQDYMLKVIREAKVETSWINRNEAYEKAMSDFLNALFREEENDFLRDFLPFQEKIAWFGMWNSLSQLVLKVMVPGIPDTYQGNEIWNFCLVDPDNRQPVNFTGREKMLSALQEMARIPPETLAPHVEELCLAPEDGRIKLYTLWKALTFRRKYSQLFKEGNYIPLQAGGSSSEHICAFVRNHGNDTVIVAVPRLVAGLLSKDISRPPIGEQVWKKTVINLPENFGNRIYRNILTGEEASVIGDTPFLWAADIFSHFPVAILSSENQR